MARAGVTGAVLAGGRSRRMGGPSKPAVELAGRALIAYPLGVLSDVCERVAVVCKRGTELAPMPAAVERWEEPDAPRHPAAGIAHALERAHGPVLVCAADMPFVSAAACRSLLRAGERAPQVRAVLARSAGRLQPVLGLYRPGALEVLRGAGDTPLTRLAETLGPVLVELPSALVRSVDTPEDLALAERELSA